MKHIKWGCIQPLTGGMYIGALNSIGHHAEWILTYDGLDSTTFKDNEIVGAANEYNLRQWLNKNNGENIPYYQIKDRKMFDMDIHTKEIRIDLSEKENVLPDYSDMDLVVAVPVCSGLSTATIAPSSTKNSKNCNMRFISKYALTNIRPKVFIMENAPALYTNTGAHMRTYFNQLAEQTDYSVVYIKTDTQLHNNCQRRPRTFVMFVRDSSKGCPELTFENKHIDVKEFFEEIDKHIKNEHFVPGYDFSRTVLKYFQEKWGDDWKNEYIIYKTGIGNIIERNLYDDFINYVNETVTDEKRNKSYIHQVDHVRYKVSIGKGFYCDTPFILNGDHTPAAIFKTIPQMYHPTEDRFISYEEALALMGMPYDFTMEPCWAGHAIGQNVPVKTAKWVVDNALNVINNWEAERKYKDNKVLFANNIKQTYHAA